MKVRLGYVSLPLTIGITSSSTVTYTNYQKLDTTNAYEKLDQVIRSNLKHLEEILCYNIKNNIHFYRLSSNLIPLSTHKDVEFDYITSYKNEYKRIANLLKSSSMRVDFHPGEFTVLNSMNREVIEGTYRILDYHYQLLKAMEISDPLCILHVGSSAAGKTRAMSRFIKNFLKLDKNIQNIVALENDDKIYNISDVLFLSRKLNVPVVLDYHHYLCNHNHEEIEKLLPDIFNSWKNHGLIPKIHFSSPKNKTKKEFRSHHDYIDVDSFIKFIELCKPFNQDIDIMIEAKMKDMALFRLVRELKYKTEYQFIDETTFIV